MTKQLPIHKDKLIVVIFAGGEGTRLWPISSSHSPKQLNTFFSKYTLLYEAYRRALKLVAKEQILVVTTKVLEERIAKRLRIPKENIIAQPSNADTSAAVAVTAFTLHTRYPNAVALILYSDHLIEDMRAFKKDVSEALHFATEHDEITTIGTKPTSPTVEYGYIRLGELVAPKVYKVDGFHEKPDKATAQQYLDAGNYVWNTGVYIWKPSILLQKIKEVQPEMYQELLRLRIDINTPHFNHSLKAWFDSVPHVSFEKSISEKLTNMYVYQGSYSWIDVGNWRTVYQLHEKDSNQNVQLNSQSNVSFIDSTNCLVYSQAKEVGLIGVKDLIVIQFDHKLLVCNQERAAEVKKLHLKENEN